MNDYGRRALTHWERWRPSQFATNQDRGLAGADEPARAVTSGPAFRPDPAGQLTPSGDRARVTANPAAIRVAQQLTGARRPATGR
jgi:hypothetical protein